MVAGTGLGCYCPIDCPIGIWTWLGCQLIGGEVGGLHEDLLEKVQRVLGAAGKSLVRLEIVPSRPSLIKLSVALPTERFPKDTATAVVGWSLAEVWFWGIN